ncbi:hypothetical protein GE118_00480 [Mycoplasma sp. NEAQ87857]|uniref:hypothetical protein n=1 Tax=Mycoplasma sp. NEAQ87857 TaxID=2683967 RepID=UPI001316C646|nr:hypothetical protein [Mycoplasma sp. NEAQ87857]QGZ97280.1 hypothetical protein GE118_00480 [Mycoplasma sp. NEAQ87857]
MLIYFIPAVVLSALFLIYYLLSIKIPKLSRWNYHILSFILIAILTFTNLYVSTLTFEKVNKTLLTTFRFTLLGFSILYATWTLNRMLIGIIYSLSFKKAFKKQEESKLTHLIFKSKSNINFLSNEAKIKILDYLNEKYSSKKQFITYELNPKFINDFDK